MMIIISTGTAAVLFGMAGIKTVPGTAVFALLYGFFSGGCKSLGSVRFSLT